MHIHHPFVYRTIVSNNSINGEENGKKKRVIDWMDDVAHGCFCGKLHAIAIFEKWIGCVELATMSGEFSAMPQAWPFCKSKLCDEHSENHACLPAIGSIITFNRR